MESHTSNPELKCPVCTHKFVSIKSLYGHMRNHPDRNWRGMKPPIPGSKSDIFPSMTVSGLGSDRDTHTGSGLIFPGWLKTRRRTRTRPGKAQMIIPVSNQPLSLIKTRPDKAWICIPASNQALPGCSISKGCDFPVLENGERVTENLPPKKRKMESGLPSNSSSKSRSPYPNRPLIINNSRKTDRVLNCGPKNLKKEELFLDDNIGFENPVSARQPHVCDVCDRAFKSYQALGGHKSHHNNNKAHEIMSIGRDNEYSTMMVVYGERPDRRSCEFVHRCPFCDRNFLKGQALGGHKRHCRHRMFSGEGQETVSGRLSFDLNELPSEWVPEETDVT